MRDRFLKFTLAKWKDLRLWNCLRMLGTQRALDRAYEQFIFVVRQIINAFDDFKRAREDCMYISG